MGNGQKVVRHFIPADYTFFKCIEVPVFID